MYSAVGIAFSVLAFAAIMNPIHTMEHYGIGAMLSSSELITTFNEAVAEVNAAPTDFGLASSLLNGSSYVLNPKALNATMDLCTHLISQGVYLVITTNAQNTTDGPYIVSYACGFYNIPVIGIAAKEAEFSDKSIHGNFLRTLSSSVDEAKAWLAIVKYFKWSRINLVATDDNDSKRLFVQFSSLAYRNSITMEFPIMIPSNLQNVTAYLKDLQSARSNIILFCSNAADALIVLRDAKLLNLTDPNFIWLLSERTIQGDSLQSAPQGSLVPRDQYKADPVGQLKDAVKVAAHALGYMHRIGPQMTPPPGSCDDPSGTWSSGMDLYGRLLNTTLESGANTTLKFDSRGDRIGTPYDITNVIKDASTGVQSLKVVGSLTQDGALSMSATHIVWPGNSSNMPQGTQMSNHLRIVTVESHPFIYVDKMPLSGNCSEVKLRRASTKYSAIPCSGKAANHAGSNHCCSGFCMDLLVRLSERVNFTYSLHLVDDGNFGSLERINGSHVKKWNGMIGEIVEGKSDMIVASLSITNERAQYIEFSKPYKYQGILILVRKNIKISSLDSFLRPFQTELWLLVLLSVHVVAVILYLLDRFSPFGRYHRSKTVKEETALNLSSAMWFSWGVLLNSGIGEGTPRSFSARVLSMVWAGFAMIIVASYTANLAAFLVLEKPKQVVSGIDDPNLRNPSATFPYATVANSSVSAYFRRQVELSTMYSFMDKLNVKNEQEGIAKVKSGHLKAFLWDSPVLYHTVSKDCALTTVGDLFGRSGYGIGMPKGSPWSEAISLSVLNFHESGVMEELESAWINFGDCSAEAAATTTLGLEHMQGVFIMVAAGIAAGVIIVIIEVLYYKQKGWRKEQNAMILRATERWQERLAESRVEKQLSSIASFGMDEKEKTSKHSNGTKPTHTNGVGKNGSKQNEAFDAAL